MSVCFCPLASGSSGNCVYVSAGKTKLLVDAGLSGIAIERALSAINVNKELLSAILITHEHSDHIQGAGILSRRFNLPLYATPGTWESIDRLKSLGKIAPKNRRFVYPNEEFAVGGITIKAFDVPHDARQPVGYTFFAGGYKLAVATDMGEITDTIKENLSGLDVLLIESNHDIEMLENGSYPAHLKRRILSKLGHLSNVSAGRLLCEIFGKNLRHVFLGHLSEENNRPLVAFETVCRILNANDVKTNCEDGLRVSVAERCSVSTLLEWD